MNEKGTIVILETDQDLWQELKTDLTALGYQAARGPFPKTEIAAITSLQPAAVIIGLTEWDDDRLQACELLLEEGKLPSDVPVIALIAGATLHEMFHRLGFADIIMRPYRLPELDFRLKRAIHQYRQRVNRDIIDIGEMSISLASYEVKIVGGGVDTPHL